MMEDSRVERDKGVRRWQGSAGCSVPALVAE